MNKINVHIYQTPVGELILGSYDNRLCLCDWRYRQRRKTIDARIQKGLGAEYQNQSDSLIEQAIDQLEDYFSHRRKQFDIPLLMVGTAFQKVVWRGLLEIPFGQTSSYTQLSERIARKQSVRAVAGANGANALSLFIPCHRIIGRHGDLVGYAGGLQAKQRLLELEHDLFD